MPVPGSDHSEDVARQRGHTGPGGWRVRPHSVQRWTTSRWSAAASHHPTVSALAAGMGISLGNQRSVIAAPGPERSWARPPHS